MRSPVLPSMIVLVLLSSSAALAAARKPSPNNRPVAYPQTARQMHLSGVVKLDLLIGANGKVKKVEILGGNPVLAAAAAETVKGWTYEPAASDTNETVVIKFEREQ